MYDAQKDFERSILNKYTEEQIIQLQACYDNPNNEYSHLSFEEYVAEAEKQNVIDELISE